MHSMTQDQAPVVIGGVDAHADTHHAAALDARGALLGAQWPRSRFSPRI